MVTIKTTSVPHKHRNRFLRDGGNVSVISGNGGGGIENESDPVFMAHAARRITSSMVTVLEKMSVDEAGNVKVDANFYSTGNVSAFGIGSDSGGGGGGGTGGHDMITSWTQWSDTGKEQYVVAAPLVHDLYTASHSHSNKSVLDSISQAYINNWNGKQDAISDLATIRSNASTGATHAATAHAPSDAQKNVQSDWNATEGDAFIKNKPSTYAPSAHNHVKSEITDFPTSMPANGGTADYAGTCTGNSATATKLQTARTLWGQSFDGSANVGGGIIFNSTDMVLSNIRLDSTYNKWTDENENVHPWYGYDHRYQNTGVNSTVIADFFGMRFKTKLGDMVLTEQGNVGVGTIAPTEKLHVNGKLKIGSAVLEYDSTNNALKISDGNNGAVNLFATGGVSAYGYGTDGGSGGGGGHDMLKSWDNYDATTHADYVVAAPLIKADHDKAHTHSNKTVLDGITAANVTAWNNAQKNVQSDWNATSGDAFIKNKPTTFTPSAHNHVKADITDFAHNHDDLYYTEDEMDTKLSGKANTIHGTHVSSTTCVTAFGTKKGAITLRSGSTTRGDVNLSMSNNELQATVVLADWAKAESKPSYAWSDITDKLVNNYSEFNFVYAGFGGDLWLNAKPTDDEDGQAQIENYIFGDGSGNRAGIKVSNINAKGSLNLTGNIVFNDTSKFSNSGNFYFPQDGNQHTWNIFNGSNRAFTVYDNGNVVLPSTDGTFIQIGGGRIVWDNANGAFKIVKSDGTTAANLYATGGISAYGGLGSYDTIDNLTISNQLTADAVRIGGGSVIKGVRLTQYQSGLPYVDIKFGSTWYRLKVEGTLTS